MLADPEPVLEMDDHAMRYGHPDAYPRLSFLPVDNPARPLSDFAERWAPPPEHRAGGFACAKVIVPGTLSMTFGHRYRRAHNLPRLATVPGLLGFRATELRPEDLNPFPHPFP